MKKIYLSGAINNCPDYEMNFWRADRFVARKYGFDTRVINPCKIKPLFGIDGYWFHMIADIWQLLKCDHIAMLSNYKTSRGALIELKIAKLFKKTVIYL